MELTKQTLLQCIEDLGRIYMEFMGEYYGERYIEININPTMKMPALFDFEALKDLYFTVELDVGASSYWSEIASMQTLDNLLAGGHISLVEYLERVPDEYITDREGLIEAVKERNSNSTGD